MCFYTIEITVKKERCLFAGEWQGWVSRKERTKSCPVVSKKEPDRFWID